MVPLSQTGAREATHCVDESLRCAAAGLPIVLLGDAGTERAKRPRFSAWGEKATTDEDTIIGWLEQYPKANIGALLGEIIDIEYDTPEGRKTADELLEGIVTPTYRSARSVHRLFKSSPLLPAVQKVECRGLEIRIGGGGKQTQSVLPPSIHPDGTPYEWLPSLSIHEAEVAEIPDHILTLIVNQEPLLSGVDADGGERRDWSEITAGVAAGGRNNAAAAMAGRLYRLALDLGDPDELRGISAEMSDWNSKNSPPLPSAELHRTMVSVLSRERQRRALSGAASDVIVGAESAQASSQDLTLDIAEPHGRTDNANARRFADRYHRELLYVPPWAKWLAWDGQRWADDSGTGARQRAKGYANSLWGELPRVARQTDGKGTAKVQSFIKSSNARGSIEAFLSLASVDSRIVCGVDELNKNPLLLNVANGTLDLSTGELRPHNPADRITQLAPVNYDPDAECPRWLETLDLIFAGDPELIRYVQQVLGYSISGDTGEHFLPIGYGAGFNGKSTIWGPVVDLLGDYAQLASDDLLLGDRSSHPTDKAQLYQVRLVPISEPEKGAALREARVKELTGDRFITARRMREDFWSFERTHTFWLSTNHLPRIDGTDEGIWRRIKLIPFTVDLRDKITPIPNFDRWLVENEGPGILAWLVQGFLDYREHGLREPEVVRAATRRYRQDSDPLGDFLDQCCVVAPGAAAPACDLFDAYRIKFGGRWSQHRFGREMGDRFPKVKARSGPHRDRVVYQGVGLLSGVTEGDLD